MKYVNIPGLKAGCSEIVLGTSGFAIDRRQDVFGILDTYIRCGGNTLDTSPMYGNGGSEAELAVWLAERQNRKNLIIINKGCHHFVDSQGIHHPEQRRVSPDILTADLMSSLTHMKLDYFDIYLIHRDDPGVPVAELIDVLEDHRNVGRINAYGVSNWSAERIDQANDYARRKGYAGIAVNSPSLSLATINEPRWDGCVYSDSEYVKWHKHNQLAMFSWAAQASGFFTGKFTRTLSPNPDIARVYYNETNWEKYRRAQYLAEQKGSGLKANHIALAYVLHQPFPACAVIGPQSASELLDSIQALNIGLTEQERLWLELSDNEKE